MKNNSSCLPTLGRYFQSVTSGMRQKLVLLLGCLFLFSINVSGQNNTISGSVKDSSGEPLLGVSVIVKHGKTVTGAVTDINGHYQVKASPDATIEFSLSVLKQ